MLLEKIKAWFLKLFGIVKGWFLKNWFMIVNYLVIFISYSIIYGHEGISFAEVLLALWMLVSVGYAGYKLFNKSNKIDK